MFLVVILLFPEVASAQGNTAAQTFVAGATRMTTLLITILNFFAWFFLSILDHIMDPKFIFALNPQTGEDGPLLFMLREIWQFTRDLVNIGFAIALIIGAIMMIVTADGTKLKEHMPKFVLGLVLVNFSWFIPRVVFDVSQVLTYTVYQIPSLMGNDGCTVPANGQDVAPRPCKIVLKFKFFEEQTRTVRAADGVDTADGSTGWSCPLPPLVCIQTVDIDQADAQVRSSTRVLDGLVVNHARLQWLADAQLTQAEVQLGPGRPTGEALQRLVSTVVKLVIILVLHIAIVFPLAAMCAAFFIRIPVLWVSMAFMPLVALGYAFPKLREGDYAELFWKWQEHFLQAVILPIRVAVPFVIGFIMLNAGAQVDAPDNLGDLPLLPIFVGVRDLWQMIWMGIAIFIIWDQSFKALSKDKAGFMGHFTDKIQGIGSSLGSIATQIPMSIPLIPVPGRAGEHISAGQALRAIDPRLLASQLKSMPRLEKGMFAQNAGIRPQAPQELSQFMQKQRQNNNIHITQNVQNLTNAAANGDAKVQREQIEKTVREMRTQFRTQTNGRTTQQIIESVMQADANFSPEHRERLLKLLRDNPDLANSLT